MSDHPFADESFEELVDAALAASRPELAIAAQTNFYLAAIVDELQTARMSRMG